MKEKLATKLKSFLPKLGSRLYDTKFGKPSILDVPGHTELSSFTFADEDSSICSKIFRLDIYSIKRFLEEGSIDPCYVGGKEVVTHSLTVVLYDSANKIHLPMNFIQLKKRTSTNSSCC